MGNAAAEKEKADAMTAVVAAAGIPEVQGVQVGEIPVDREVLAQERRARWIREVHEDRVVRGVGIPAAQEAPEDRLEAMDLRKIPWVAVIFGLMPHADQLAEFRAPRWRQGRGFRHPFGFRSRMQA